MDNNFEDKKIEEKISEGKEDSLMEQINSMRIEQKIEKMIPEKQKQQQNFYYQNQKALFLLFLISVIINIACFVVLLFF